jgi:hypothetical protein
MFGQQRDERKAWVPNYDLFFFEVETRPSASLCEASLSSSEWDRTSSGVKMLHEMRPGEMGSMIVSTPVLARYKMRTALPHCGTAINTAGPSGPAFASASSISCKRITTARSARLGTTARRQKQLQRALRAQSWPPIPTAHRG